MLQVGQTLRERVFAIRVRHQGVCFKLVSSIGYVSLQVFQFTVILHTAAEQQRSRLESGDFVPLKLSRSADCWPCWRFLACRQEEFSLLHDLLQLIGCSLGFASMMPVFPSLVISRRPCSRGHAASSFNAVTNVL